MVLLRLIVKVLPREAPGQPSSGSGKIPSFLLIAREPEKLTLAGLVWMITEKWSRMRPMDPYVSFPLSLSCPSLALH